LDSVQSLFGLIGIVNVSLLDRGEQGAASLCLGNAPAGLLSGSRPATDLGHLAAFDGPRGSFGCQAEAVDSLIRMLARSPGTILTIPVLKALAVC